MLESPKPPSGVGPRLAIAGIEAAPSSATARVTPLSSEFQTHLDPRAVRVLARVGDGLLRDAQQRELDIGGERPRRAGDDEPAWHSGPARVGFALQRFDQRPGLECGRTEIPDGAARLLQRRASVRLGGEELALGAIRFGGDRPARRPQLEGQGEERLRQGVVDLPRQAVALFGHPQIAAGRVEPGVLDADRRMLGEERQQLDLLLAEATVEDRWRRRRRCR